MRAVFFPLLALALAGCGLEPLPDPKELCGDGSPRGAVITRLAFAEADENGFVKGFDVDSRVSDAEDSVTCGQADFTAPDGTPGIDNQLAVVMPDARKLFGDAVDGLVQNAIDNGELLIMLDGESFEDTHDDACVDFAIQLAKDKPVAVGTDGAMEAYQTFDLDGSSPRSEIRGGAIAAGVLDAGPGTIVVPLALFDVSFMLHIYHARFHFDIGEDGDYHGYFGGGIEVEELIDGVKDGAGLAEEIPLLKVALMAARDLDQDEDGRCRRLSAALEFDAKPAFIRGTK